MARLLILFLATAQAAVFKTSATSDDGTALALERCKHRFSSGPLRKQCKQSYLERKRPTTIASSESSTSLTGCAEPSDGMSTAERLRIDQCLHAPETHEHTDWLHSHISSPVNACVAGTDALSPSARARCLAHVGSANWTARGLTDGMPECGRAWFATGCARKLFAGRDVLFIGNSVIRRQMYTVIDILAGPSARRLTRGSKPRSIAEVVPRQPTRADEAANPSSDVGMLEDAALLHASAHQVIIHPLHRSALASIICILLYHPSSKIIFCHLPPLVIAHRHS